MKKRIIILTYEMPEGVTKLDVEEFIITELSCGGGSRHPSDPLFNSLKGIKIIHHGEN